MLADARVLLGTTGLCDGSDEAYTFLPDHNTLMLVFGKLDANVGRLLLKKDSRHGFKDWTQIARLFLDDLKKQHPEARLDAYEALWFFAPEEASSQAVASSPAAVTSSPAETGPKIALYETNVAGERVDPIALLRQRGFDLAADVKEEGSSESYTIKAVEGSGQTAKISLKERGNDEKEIQKYLKAFLANWSIADLKAEVVPHPGWPALRTVALPSVQEIFQEAAVADAVGKVATHIEARHDPKTHVQIFSKPFRKVVTLGAKEVGDIVLGPDTTSIKVIDPAKQLEVGFEPEVYVENCAPGTKFVLGSAAGPNNVSPYWCVTRTDVKDRCLLSPQNMGGRTPPSFQ